MSEHYFVWMVVMEKADGTRTVVKGGLTRFKAVETQRMLNQAAAAEGIAASFRVERRAA